MEAGEMSDDNQPGIASVSVEEVLSDLDSILQDVLGQSVAADTPLMQVSNLL
jgi:hypothetical protein